MAEILKTLSRLSLWQTKDLWHGKLVKNDGWPVCHLEAPTNIPRSTVRKVCCTETDWKWRSCVRAGTHISSAAQHLLQLLDDCVADIYGSLMMNLVYFLADQSDSMSIFCSPWLLSFLEAEEEYSQCLIERIQDLVELLNQNLNCHTALRHGEQSWNVVQISADTAYFSNIYFLLKDLIFITFETPLCWIEYTCTVVFI